MAKDFIVKPQKLINQELKKVPHYNGVYKE